MKKMLNTLARYTTKIYNKYNNDNFYNNVNPVWSNYYLNVVKPSAQFLDGFVPKIHSTQDGFFSTKICSKIINGLASSIYGHGIIFKKGNSTEGYKGLNFISHTWCDKTNFKKAVKKVIAYTMALGTAAIKINKKSDGELWCEPMRLDTFEFDMDSDNKVEKFSTFLNAYTSVSIDKEGANRNFVLYEERYFVSKPSFEDVFDNKTGKTYQVETMKKWPKVIYQIYEKIGNNNKQKISFKVLPPEIRQAIQNNYGALMFEKEQALPFNEHLGVVIFQYEGGDITMPNCPFGKNIVYENIADFLKYDMAFSYSVRDMYNGRGKVGTPKSLSQGDLNMGAMSKPIDVSKNTDTTAYGSDNSAASDDEVEQFQFSGAMGIDGQKPVVIQHEMRGQEWTIIRDDIIKSIATSIGVNPRTLASYLGNGNEKTAEQTHSEDDTMSEWIVNHRDDFIFGLNEIVEIVLSYNGFTDNVDVRFATNINIERELGLIEKKLTLGLIDIEDAIRELNPDEDEEVIQKKINKANQIAKEKQEKLLQQANVGFDFTSGDFN